MADKEQPARSLEVNAVDEITMKGSLRYKLKRGGVGEPVVDGFSGDDLHRKSNRWMHKVQIVDRGKDRYFKEIVDPTTGEVVRRCDEPLSQHRGYGSAKKRPPSKSHQDDPISLSVQPPQ